MGGGKTIPGMLEGVPWGHLPVSPGVKPSKHSQSTNKPAKGEPRGYLQPLTPLPQPRASVSPWKQGPFVPGVFCPLVLAPCWDREDKDTSSTHHRAACNAGEPCELHSTSAWKQEQWENAALPLQSPGSAPSPATSHQKNPDYFQVLAG